MAATQNSSAKNSATVPELKPEEMTAIVEARRKTDFTQFKNQNSNYKLRVNSAAEIPLHRLPYVGCPTPKAFMRYWNVPDAGGYFGAGEAAKHLTQFYLKYLLDHGVNNGMLQHIAFDMFGHGSAGDSENHASLSDSRRGAVVGFFCELEKWLFTAVSMRRAELNNMDVDAVLRAAEDGLNFDETPWYAAMRRSDRAKNKGTKAKTPKEGK